MDIENQWNANGIPFGSNVSEWIFPMIIIMVFVDRFNHKIIEKEMLNMMSEKDREI